MSMIFLSKFSVLERDSVTNLQMDSEDLLSDLAFGYHAKDISLQPTIGIVGWWILQSLLVSF